MSHITVLDPVFPSGNVPRRVRHPTSLPPVVVKQIPQRKSLIKTNGQSQQKIDSFTFLSPSFHHVFPCKVSGPGGPGPLTLHHKEIV
jgi:hypothetical protein